ncbi:hypothetical protein HanRHA438_Chr11g0522481 [Helianthus annuus]|nr:hypothetical protein HanRHA438_Chr11g0522481 [Helianthus annuus]
MACYNTLINKQTKKYKPTPIRYHISNEYRYQIMKTTLQDRDKNPYYEVMDIENIMIARPKNPYQQVTKNNSIL